MKLMECERVAVNVSSMVGDLEAECDRVSSIVSDTVVESKTLLENVVESRTVAELLLLGVAEPETVMVTSLLRVLDGGGVTYIDRLNDGPDSVNEGSSELVAEAVRLKDPVKDVVSVARIVSDNVPEYESVVEDETRWADRVSDRLPLKDPLAERVALAVTLTEVLVETDVESVAEPDASLDRVEVLVDEVLPLIE